MKPSTFLQDISKTFFKLKLRKKNIRAKRMDRDLFLFTLNIILKEEDNVGKIVIHIEKG